MNLGPPDAEDVWYNAVYGDVEEVERCLRAAPAGSVNHIGVKGWTPLYAAATRGHSEVVELLLQHKADPEVSADDSWRPLMTAAQEGHGGRRHAVLGHLARHAEVVRRQRLQA